jgi:disease resistance protein RPM1
VVKHPTFPKVEDGALPLLMSLQLLCEDLDDQCIVQIKGFTRLREVVLFDELNTDVKGTWVQAVKEHQNRPKVLLLKRADPPQGATEIEITECFALSEGRVEKTGIQMPPDEPKFASNNKGQPVACVALTGLPIAATGTVSS